MEKPETPPIEEVAPETATGGGFSDDKVFVPDLVGKSYEAAVAELERLGLGVELSEAKSSGAVAGQQPQAGAPVDPGSVVEIALESVEPEPRATVRVPDVRHMTLKEAGSALRAAGLEPKERLVHGPIEPNAGPMGEVYAQEPAAGRKVARGSKVTISSWWERE